MKLAFIDTGPLDYTPQTPFDQPLGGAESATAYLTAALAARGHEITLVNRSSTLGVVRGVQVSNPDHVREAALNRFDAVVSITRPIGAAFRQSGVTAPMISWQHQAPDVPAVAGFAAPDEQAAWSDFVFVSDRQRQSFRTRFGIDGAVLRNAASPGVLDTPLSPACFLDRGEDPVLIYASGPTHGLDLLLIAFASIRERLPGARLLICADNRLYQKNGASDPSATLYALARALPGVELVGSLSQTALGAQFARADILAYPTNFVETSCIAAIEAASAGCLFAGTDYGALRETLAGFGVFIPISGARRQLEQAFADLVITTVEDARANPETFKRRRLEQAAMFRATHSWERRAAEWEAWLEQRLGAKFQR